jgi:hypothetical protein
MHRNIFDRFIILEIFDQAIVTTQIVEKLISNENCLSVLFFVLFALYSQYVIDRIF